MRNSYAHAKQRSLIANFMLLFLRIFITIIILIYYGSSQNRLFIHRLNLKDRIARITHIFINVSVFEFNLYKCYEKTSKF